MKIFLSWSGPQSRGVAEALNDWLPRVIQAVRVFYSPDIEKGAKWSGEIDDALEGTSFGIVCLTPQNLKSEWIHYEAGALSKMREARVWTFLLDLTPGDVGQPLGRFQHTVAEKEDVLKLVRTINSQLAAAGAIPLPDRLLDEIFDDSWPRLGTRLEAARQMSQQGENNVSESAASRDDRAMLEEILELLRDQQRRLNVLESPVSTAGASSTASEARNADDERIRLAAMRLATGIAAAHLGWAVGPPPADQLCSGAVLGIRGSWEGAQLFVAELERSLSGASVDLAPRSRSSALITVILRDELQGPLFIATARSGSSAWGVTVISEWYLLQSELTLGTENSTDQPPEN